MKNDSFPGYGLYRPGDNVESINMKIGVIQASSQAGKNRLIYDTVKKYAVGSEVINFGCTGEEAERYSYIEISILAGMLSSDSQFGVGSTIGPGVPGILEGLIYRATLRHFPAKPNCLTNA